MPMIPKIVSTNGSSKANPKINVVVVKNDIYSLIVIMGLFTARVPALGAKLVIVNHQDTDMDALADLVIQAGIGDTMTALLGRMA